MSFQRENQRISATDLLQELVLGNEIRLNKCTIAGQLDVNRLLQEEEGIDLSALKLNKTETQSIITFDQPITFNGCVFEDDLFFAPPWEDPDILQVVFSSDIAFNSSVFKGQARFTNSVFKGYCSFDGCYFERIACFRNSVFQGPAMYRTVAFDGYGLFTGVIFQSEARYTNTYFSKGGNFTNVRFEDKTDFSGVYSRSKSVPVYESVRFARHTYGDDETFWRFIKQAAQEAGYYQLAGESFYNERCAHLWRKLRGPNYDDLSLSGKFGRVFRGLRLLPEFVFGKLLFGYGERPTRVLIASALIILICAVFYCSPAASITYRADISTEQFTFIDGLYFSTITFTTLGFGDIHPVRTHTLTKSIAMAESIAGACLMALFVVSLSKRYSRG